MIKEGAGNAMTGIISWIERWKKRVDEWEMWVSKGRVKEKTTVDQELGGGGSASRISSEPHLIHYGDGRAQTGTF